MFTLLLLFLLLSTVSYFWWGGSFRCQCCRIKHKEYQQQFHGKQPFPCFMSTLVNNIHTIPQIDTGLWSHVRPNFSRVRLTKIPGRTGASSDSRKEKKVSATQKLCGSTKDTPDRLISWSKPIRDSEGRTPPLIGRCPDIPVCVCARWQMRHVCCCSQTERKRWVVEMRAVLPT